MHLTCIIWLIHEGFATLIGSPNRYESLTLKLIATCNKIFIHVMTGQGCSCQAEELLSVAWATEQDAFPTPPYGFCFSSGLHVRQITVQ